MNPRATLRLGLALLLASLATLGVAIPAMASRLREHNEQAAFPRFAFNKVLETSFDFAGEPVEIRLNPGQGGPRGTVDVAWRGRTIRLESTGEIDPRLPGLTGVEDWLQVHEMKRLPPGTPTGEPPADWVEEPSRLVIVARQTPENDDPKTWGQVARKHWLYEIVQLRRPPLDAGAEPEPVPEALPDPDLAAVGPYGRRPSVPPVNDFAMDAEFARWRLNFVALPGFQRTWQYAAALAVTPVLKYPRNQFTDDGMSAMHWTWPAAGFGVLGSVVGGIIVAGSLVRRPPGRGVA